VPFLIERQKYSSWPNPTSAATLRGMMRRAHLTDEDLEMIEQACRNLVARYRNDAKRQANPSIRDGLLDNAQLSRDSLRLLSRNEPFSGERVGSARRSRPINDRTSSGGSRAQLRAVELERWKAMPCSPFHDS